MLYVKDGRKTLKVFIFFLLSLAHFNCLAEKKNQILCGNKSTVLSENKIMCSATYVENYLDSVENLPNDVQRHLTRIREIDLQYRGK